MRRRRSEVHELRNAADLGDESQHLVGLEQSAVAGLRALAVLDLDRAGVLDHIRKRPDDLVPSEIAGRDLENEIFYVARFEDARRHAAFAGAHDNRNAFHLVQVGNAHGQPFPHMGRERADGHGPDPDRENFAHRRNKGALDHRKLVAGHLDRKLFRRKVPAQERTHAKLMPACVKRRVGQHRDAGKLEFVEGRNLRIVPAAAAHIGNAALVLEVIELVLKVVFREDRVRGADERAGAAADAIAFDLRALAHDMGKPAAHFRLGA